MGMPCSITGDLSLGHTGFTPSPITPTTTTVLVLNVPPHVVGDVIAPHVLGTSVHGGTVGLASTTVLVQNKGLARMMDKGDCGALILGTAATIMVGG